MDRSSVIPNAQTEEEPQIEDVSPNEVEETEQPPQEDWETRFKGLQGGYQQAVERAQTLEQMVFAQQAQQFAQSLQGLDPDEANMRYQTWVQQQQLTRAQRQMSEQMSQADQALKMVAVMTLSQKYGVPKEDLMSFNDPDSMEAAAKLASKNRRAGKKAGTQEPRQRDDFGSTSNVVTQPKEKAKNLRDARNRFKEAAKAKFGDR